MATLNFYLTKPKPDGTAIIRLVVLVDGARIFYPTGERIVGKHWDAKRQRLKPHGANATSMNAYLDRLEAAAKTALLEARTQGVKVDKAWLLRYVEPGRDAKLRGVLDLFDEYLELRGATRKPGTLKVYRTLRNALAAMQAHDGRVFQVRDLTLDFLERFTVFTLAGGVNNETLAKRLKMLRVFVNWLRLRDLDVPRDFDRFKLTLKTQGSDKPALTVEEFRRLRDFAFDERPNWDGQPGDRLARNRDVFVAACLTGLRYSDLAALRLDAVVDGKLKIVERKTGRTLRLELLPDVVRILERYGGALPVPSNVELNRVIKHAARLAGIDAVCVEVEFKGVERVERTLPKWRLVTAHTARRTFIALGLALGVPVQVMQRMVGHATMRQTQAYLDTTDADVEAGMSKLRGL